MKYFLKEILWFCIPLLLLILLGEFYVRNRPSVFREKKEQLINNADSVEVLIVGNSHAMNGINSDLFTMYAHNIAFGSQSIYFDRRITEKYLPILKNLKYVLISLDYFTLYVDHEENRDFFYKYYYDIDYEDRKFFKEFLLQSFFVYSPQQTFSLFLEDLSIKPEAVVKGWSGNYKSDYNAVTSPEECEIRANTFNKRIDTYEGGDAILKDLESFIENLKAQNITPILVTCPVYSTLRPYFYKDVLERNEMISDYLTQKYGITHLYYEDDDNYEVSDYYNCDHLNAAGAEKLVPKLDSAIIDIESLTK